MSRIPGVGGDNSSTGASGARLHRATESLEALAVDLERARDVRAVFAAVCRHAIAVIPAAGSAGTAVVRPEGAVDLFATDRAVRDLGSALLTDAHGPRPPAPHSRAVIRVELPADRSRYPTFAARAAPAGLHSALHSPVVLDSGCAGSLNLYSSAERSFGEIDEALLGLYVTAATAAARNARHLHAARAEVDNLATALASRAVIEQAKGIIMALRGICADRAFDALVRRSQRENVKLRDLAVRVVGSVSNGSRSEYSRTEHSRSEH